MNKFLLAAALATLGVLTGCGGGDPHLSLLTSIQISSANSTIDVGQTQQFTATGTFSDGSTRDLTKLVTWGSSNTTVATISSSGLALSHSQGSSIISATFYTVDGPVTGATTLNVVVVPLKSLTITPVSPFIANRASLQLTATGIFSDGSTQNLTASVIWTSSSNAIATVSSRGMVTGTGVGNATITATQGGVSGATSVTVTAATLTSITITPPNSSIAKGTSQQLIATGNFSDGTTQNLTPFVTWASSNPFLVAISNAAGSRGLVTGKGVASATITATQGGVSGATSVTVTAATLTSITITPPNSSIAKGTSQQLIATGNFSDGTTQNLTPFVNWASSNPSLSAISNAAGSQGLATGTGVGSATITATQGGVSGATTVTVTAATLTSITITPPNASIAKGTSQQLIATGNFSDGTTQNLTAFVTWVSSDQSLATVSNAAGSQGLVTGTGVGSATITATQGGVSGATTVTVTAAILTSITITPPNSSIATGTSVQLVATGNFSDGTAQNLTPFVNWVSSAPSLAAVSSQGLVTGTGVGNATITATQGGVSGATTVTVTAAILTSITITPPNSSIATGTSVQLVATGNFSDGTAQNLTPFVNWVSSAPSLAAVSSQGLVTGTGVGNATITATQGGVSGATTVTVTAAILTSITITPPNSSIATGTSVQLVATGNFSDGTAQNLTPFVNWVSSAPSLAAVSSQGLVTGTGVGNATITATQGEVSGATTVTVTAAILTSITITPPNSSIATGTSVQLVATGNFSDGTAQNLTPFVNWVSSAPSLAAVSSQGLVTGTGAGSATITATQGGVSGSALVTVTAAILTSITITPPNASIAKGTSVQLVATGNFSDGTAQNLTAFVTWVSSDQSLATVSNAAGSQGLVTGTGVGSATITATQGGVSGATTVTVTAATLTSITITPPNSSIAKGTSVQLVATGNFSDGTAQNLTAFVTWVSSDQSLATVSNAAGSQGLVTGTGVGSATITATQGGVSGATTVTVTAATLTSITITPPNSSIAKGTSVQLVATGNFSDGTTQDLTTLVSWASSDPSLATASNAVGSQGLVTGTGVGSATITATQGGVSGATTVTVTAATLTSITITPPNSSIANGTSVQLIATGNFSDGTTQDLTTLVSWASSDPSLATASNAVGSQGLVTGTGVGNATITATQGGVSGATTVTVTAATLTSITITPPNSSIANGTSVQLVATGNFSDGTTQDLTTLVSWASSDPSLATASNAAGSQGLVTGTGVGSATITATQAGVSGATTVMVTHAVLIAIGVTPANPSIANGTTEQLKATGAYSDGSTQDLTAQVSWTSSSDTMATVSSGGLVTGTGEGSATITATVPGVTGSTTVTVTPPVLTSITITPANSSISNGTTEPLIATGTFSDGSTQVLTGSVAWVSSDQSLATVSNAAGSQGLVTGTGVGSVTITATQAGVSGSTAVTVTAAVLTSITITPANSSITNGVTEQLIATGTFSDGSAQDLTAQVSWTSSSDTMATVNSGGLVTGTGEGSATITATLQGVAGSTTVTVVPACSMGDGETVAAYNALPFAAVNCAGASYSFEADAVSEFGDEVGLAADTGTTLVSLQVWFTSLGCSDSGHWYDGGCLTTPGATFDHPITANIYAVNDCGGTPCPGALLATVTQTQTIPYRPSADPNCPDPTRWHNPLNITSPGGCQSGISTVLVFTFTPPVALPDQVIWTVAFNTTDYGANPIGQGAACFTSAPGCPYDGLNVGVKSYPGAPYAGTDIDPSGAFQNSSYAGAYCDGGAGGTGSLRLDTPCWTGYTPLGEVITTSP